MDRKTEEFQAPEIVYFVASSIDGFIATDDGGVDWLAPFNDSGEDFGYGKFYASIDAILMGSGTYEFALKRASWPHSGMPTWVFTNRDLPLLDPAIELTSRTPREVAAALRVAGVERAWLMGGGKLANSLRGEGLLSEYMIAVVPVMLGSGIPLFANGQRIDSLKLVDAKRYECGIVGLHYQSRATATGR